MTEGSNLLHKPAWYWLTVTAALLLLVFASVQCSVRIVVPPAVFTPSFRDLEAMLKTVDRGEIRAAGELQPGKVSVYGKGQPVLLTIPAHTSVESDLEIVAPERGATGADLQRVRGKVKFSSPVLVHRGDSRLTVALRQLDTENGLVGIEADLFQTIAYSVLATLDDRSAPSQDHRQNNANLFTGWIELRDIDLHFGDAAPIDELSIDKIRYSGTAAEDTIAAENIQIRIRQPKFRKLLDGIASYKKPLDDGLIKNVSLAVFRNVTSRGGELSVRIGPFAGVVRSNHLVFGATAFVKNMELRGQTSHVVVKWRRFLGVVPYPDVETTWPDFVWYADASLATLGGGEIAYEEAASLADASVRIALQPGLSSGRLDALREPNGSPVRHGNATFLMLASNIFSFQIGQKAMGALNDTLKDKPLKFFSEPVPPIAQHLRLSHPEFLPFENGGVEIKGSLEWKQSRR